MPRAKIGVRDGAKLRVVRRRPSASDSLRKYERFERLDGDQVDLCARPLAQHIGVRYDPLLPMPAGETFAEL
jgi:hypothetical protein